MPERSWYFNSQPHKEADYVAGNFSFRDYISTHSLTRRLTTVHSVRDIVPEYFNSQPHKEADCLIGTIAPDTIVFQLTASQGG